MKILKVSDPEILLNEYVDYSGTFELRGYNFKRDTTYEIYTHGIDESAFKKNSTFILRIPLGTYGC
jgi:hypothetical protein